MADNLTANPGSGGGVLATDEIAGVHYPRNKLIHGADGVNAGDVSTANPLPVQLRRTSDGAEIGTAALPLRTDPTGTTAQPVSIAATVTVDTEMPAAAALADAAGNPTAPILGSGNLVYNGTTWDRARGDITNGLDVDVTRLPALVAGSAAIGKLAANSGVIIGGVEPVAATTGGATPYRYIIAAAANQDSQSVKASAGTLYSIDAFSVVAGIRYLKLYDKASAPTSGDTPVHTFVIPGNTSGAGFTKSIPVGIAFANGIAFRVTTGLADNDTGAATANDGVINLDYK